MEEAVLVREEEAQGRDEASEESLASLGLARTPTVGRLGHPTEQASRAHSRRWLIRWPPPRGPLVGVLLLLQVVVDFAFVLLNEEVAIVEVTHTAAQVEFLGPECGPVVGCEGEGQIIAQI
ncbi:hypothetical protein QYE76_045442 [Lolium multiflorum]|uniref:Uncharacterized protein n=1 Tax=Lolium multiflorum TaxID=4521 RepID=A0AAD8TKG2_LOLMU|nr:hypothetical protein QYE76_045442 [Lolium multiflorum]